MVTSYKYISLFSGGGIGDIGFKQSGLEPLIMCEIEESRAKLLELNFKNSLIINDDINNSINDIVTKSKKLLNKQDLFLISATPPCQGMSKNGIGSLLKAIREGKRPALDERNLLFLPALKLVEELKPQYFFFENVDRMINQYYIHNTDKMPMTEYIEKELKRIGYKGSFHLVNFADYGVPQNRRRLIGLFSREDVIMAKLPDPKYKEKEDLLHFPHKTLFQEIGHLPSLDSKDKENARSDFHILHQTSVSRPDLYYWIKHTKEGDTAFNNNTCPKCNYISSKEDVYCKKCNHLLPKPTILKNGEYRLIKGFISSYKRMKYDLPAPTITTRSAYAGSDNNIHPVQNRVLSIYEVAKLQGLNVEDYIWGPYNNKPIPPITVLRDILGEPVSPIVTKIIGDSLLNL